MIFEATAGGQTLRLAVRGRNGEYTVEIEGRKLRVEVSETAPFMILVIDGKTHEAGLSRRGAGFDVVLPESLVEVQLKDVTRAAAPAASRVASGPARVIAPMPGKVARVLVTLGQTVAAGAGLVVIEAMKMENELSTPRAGQVQALPVREGQAVESGVLLAVVG